MSLSSKAIDQSSQPFLLTSLPLHRSADLDSAFGRLSAANYRALLAKHRDAPPVDEPADDCVHCIMIAERDAVIAHSLRRAARLAGASSVIVGVVGEPLASGLL